MIEVKFVGLTQNCTIALPIVQYR